jgi:hypothetical protein
MCLNNKLMCLNTSINPSNWNVIYDGNAGQYNLQNNDGPYSYTITFQNAIQLKQLKLGSTDGGANNSLTGHPSKSVKFEYQLENGSFVEHSTVIMKDITSGENGTETFNTNVVIILGKLQTQHIH